MGSPWNDAWGAFCSQIDTFGVERNYVPHSMRLQDKPGYDTSYGSGDHRDTVGNVIACRNPLLGVLGGRAASRRPGAPDIPNVRAPKDVGALATTG